VSFPYRVRVSASISAPITSRQESRRNITLELPLVPTERLRGFERELSARVDEAGRALERDLNEAIAQVYVEAMEERARGLGEVESVRRERVGSEVVLEITVAVTD
jgi:hypothetical protein